MFIPVLTKFLPRTLEKINSPLNGEISVVEQFGQRKIVVGGLTQSGQIVEEIWGRTIKLLLQRRAEVARQKFSAESNRSLKEKNQIEELARDSSKIWRAPRAPKILILGLGGGSLVKLLNLCFPKAKIIGVEIDPLMTAMGKKYLGLEKARNLEIKIANAGDFVKGNFQFDLILIDLYLGNKIPQSCQTLFFLHHLKKNLKKNGVVIFNRLYYKNHIFEAKKFLDKLKKIFDDVSYKKVFTNLLIFCKNS